MNGAFTNRNFRQKMKIDPISINKASLTSSSLPALRNTITGREGKSVGKFKDIINYIFEKKNLLNKNEKKLFIGVMKSITDDGVRKTHNKMESTKNISNLQNQNDFLSKIKQKKIDLDHNKLKYSGILSIQRRFTNYEIGFSKDSLELEYQTRKIVDKVSPNNIKLRKFRPEVQKKFLILSKSKFI